MATHNNDPPVSAGYRVYVIVRKILIYLLAAAIVVAGLLFAASNSPNKSIFGYRYYTVLTPSMEPSYKGSNLMTNTKKKKSAKEKRALIGALLIAAVTVAGSTLQYTSMMHQEKQFLFLLIVIRMEYIPEC